MGEIVRGCVHRKKVVFWGRRGTFSGAPPPRLSRSRPNFYTPRSHSKYFVLAEFHPPRLSFGGVMPPTPSFASLHLWPAIYSIWQAIIIIQQLAWVTTTAPTFQALSDPAICWPKCRPTTWRTCWPIRWPIKYLLVNMSANIFPTVNQILCCCYTCYLEYGK